MLFFFLITISVSAFIVVVGLLIVGYLTRSMQNSFLYQPNVPEGSVGTCDSPASYGVSRYESLSISTEDGVCLKGYVIWPDNYGVGVKPPVTSINSGGEKGNQVTEIKNVKENGRTFLGFDNKSGKEKIGEYLLSPGNSTTNLTTEDVGEVEKGRLLQTVDGNPKSSQVTFSDCSLTPGRFTPPGGGSGVAIDIENNPKILKPSSSATHAQFLRSSSFNVDNLPTPAQTKDCILVYFHGNAGNVGHRINIAIRLIKALECPVVMVDYRGYGCSEGAPNAGKRKSASSSSLPPTPFYANVNSAAGANAKGGDGSSVDAAESAGKELSQAFSINLKKEFRGKSPTKVDGPTEEGLKRDGEAVMDYVINNLLSKLIANDTGTNTERRIIVMGTSLGGAVSVHVAQNKFYQRYIAFLILENTFSSVSDMVDSISGNVLRHHLTESGNAEGNGDVRGNSGFSSAPSEGLIHSYRNWASSKIKLLLLKGIYYFFVFVAKPLVLAIGWKSVVEIKKIRIPIIFLSGKLDEIVPAEHMRVLFNAAENTIYKKFVEFPEGSHNDLPLQPDYEKLISKNSSDILRQFSQIS